MSPIDIVIPHVNGSAPGYEDLCRLHTGEFIPCHLRALGELRYVLRSIETYADWSRVILVVQSQAHVPDWLEPGSVRIVEHKDFIPAELLPTFHWATIVSHMHLIPGISDRYIVWEDDVILGTPRRPEDFFSEDGLPQAGWEVAPIVPGLEAFLGMYQRNLANSRTVLRRKFSKPSTCFVFPHSPLPVSQKHWTEFFKIFMEDEIFSGTVRRKSRGDERANPTIEPTVIYANWVEFQAGSQSTARRYLSCLRHLTKAAGSFLGMASPPEFAKYPVVNNQERLRRNMSKLLAEGAAFRNVNDEAYDHWEGDDINPNSVRLLIETLQMFLPDPSKFEKKAGSES